MYESNRNKRSKSRDSWSQYVNNISISNMDSVRMQLGMLSMLTSQTNELSRSTQVNNIVLILGKIWIYDFYLI